MGLSRAEMETVVRWDAADPVVHVWTAEPKTLRKLKRLGHVPTRTQGPGAWFSLEKRAITLRRPRTPSRTPPRQPVFARKPPPTTEKRPRKPSA